MICHIKGKFEVTRKCLTKFTKFDKFIAKILRKKLVNLYSVEVNFVIKEQGYLQINDIIFFENRIKLLIVDTRMETQFNIGKNVYKALNVCELTYQETETFKDTLKTCIKLCSTYKER